MSTGVRVTGLAEDVEEKHLKIYFSNPRNGGGRVKEIHYPLSGNSAVVFFDKKEVVESLMNKDHTIHGTDVTLMDLPRPVFRRSTVELAPELTALLNNNSTYVDELQYDKDLTVDFDYSSETYTLTGSWYQLEWAQNYLSFLAASANVLNDAPVPAPEESPPLKITPPKAPKTRTPASKRDDTATISVAQSKASGPLAVEVMEADEETPLLPIKKGVNFEDKIHVSDGKKVTDAGLEFPVSLIGSEVDVGNPRSTDSLPSKPISKGAPEKKNKNKNERIIKGHQSADTKGQSGCNSNKNMVVLQKYTPKPEKVEADVDEAKPHMVKDQFEYKELRDSPEEGATAAAFKGHHRSNSSDSNSSFEGVYFNPDYFGSEVVGACAAYPGMRKPAPKPPTTFPSFKKTSGIDVSHTDFGDVPLTYEFRTARGMMVRVVMDDITKQTTDAIVNPTGPDLANSYGVSKAIAGAAGPQMAAECKQHVREHGMMIVSDVVHTCAGGSLDRHVGFILHAIGPRWVERESDSCTHVLVCTYLNALQYANHRLWLRSLATPLISAGAYGFPLDVCVQAFFDAVMLHSSDNSQSRHLQEVILVGNDPDSTGAAIVIIRSLMEGQPGEMERAAVDRYYERAVQFDFRANEFQSHDPGDNRDWSDEEEEDEIKKREPSDDEWEKEGDTVRERESGAREKTIMQPGDPGQDEDEYKYYDEQDDEEEGEKVDAQSKKDGEENSSGVSPSLVEDKQPAEQSAEDERKMIAEKRLKVFEEKRTETNMKGMDQKGAGGDKGEKDGGKGQKRSDSEDEDDEHHLSLAETVKVKSVHRSIGLSSERSEERVNNGSVEAERKKETISDPTSSGKIQQEQVQDKTSSSNIEDTEGESRLSEDHIDDRKGYKSLMSSQITNGENKLDLEHNRRDGVEGAVQMNASGGGVERQRSYTDEDIPLKEKKDEGEKFRSLPVDGGRKGTGDEEREEFKNNTSEVGPAKDDAEGQ